jgi:hypothetical protein
LDEEKTMSGELTFGPGNVRDVAIGAVVEAEELSVRVFALLRVGMAQPRRTMAGNTEAGMIALRRRIAALAERGAAERSRGWNWATESLNAAVRTVATSPPVDRAVDAQLDRVLRPLVSAVLDDVLDLLEREPERIRSLVRSQRTTMVDELMNRVRSGAAAGDSSVDRVTTKMLHPKTAATPPGVEPT